MDEHDQLNQENQAKVGTAFAEGCTDFSETKLDEVLKDSDIAREKASKHLGQLFEEFKLLWQLLCDYKAGRYTNVPWKFIAAVGFSILYLVNPFDVIPDVLPAIGYLDDVSVFGLVLAGFKSEIEAYRNWKKNGEKKVEWIGAVQLSPGSGKADDGSSNAYRLPDDYPAPRNILKVHFPKKADQLCFSGGWGYDAKTATVVKEFDPEVNPTEHFDGVSLETVFIQKRIWEELEFSRPAGKRFYGMEFNKVSQQLVEVEGIPHDVIEVEVTAYPEADWNQLKADWQAHDGYKDDPEGKAKHNDWNQRCKINLKEEFWFDIRDFF